MVLLLCLNVEIRIGTWSLCSCSKVLQVSSVAMEGLDSVRSIFVAVPELGWKYVNSFLFMHMRALLFIKFSIVVPLGFLVVDPQRGLWALKSPNMSLGCGS